MKLPLELSLCFTEVRSKCYALANNSRGRYRSNEVHHQGSKALHIRGLKREFELINEHETCENVSDIEFIRLH